MSSLYRNIISILLFSQIMGLKARPDLQLRKLQGTISIRNHSNIIRQDIDLTEKRHKHILQFKSRNHTYCFPFRFACINRAINSSGIPASMTV